jgi:uncharacterized membrane protein YtjA (UPF0391 family)
MFEYAAIFLLVSLLTGTLGLTNISDVARRVSIAVFAVSFLAFLALLGVAFFGRDGFA